MSTLFSPKAGTSFIKTDNAQESSSLGSVGTQDNNTTTALPLLIMPVTESEFQTHAELVKKYKQCTNDEQLELYGWFKQATVGDCNTERPGMFDLKGKAKWDAWKSREGSGKGTAMEKYCEVVRGIQEKYD